MFSSQARSDLYRLGRRVSRQRRNERRVPTDRFSPRSRRHDRRRRVQLRVDLLREKPAGRCGLRRWQRCDAERVGWRARGGILRGVPDADFAAVRRDGGESRLREGILHLHHHRHSAGGRFGRCDVDGGEDHGKRDKMQHQ